MSEGMGAFCFMACGSTFCVSCQQQLSLSSSFCLHLFLPPSLLCYSLPPSLPPSLPSSLPPCRQLSAHRKSVIENSNPTPSTSTLTPSPTTQSHTPSSTSTPSPSHTSTNPPQGSTSPKHTQESPSTNAGRSPRPKRKAPAPPVNAAQKKENRRSMPVSSMAGGHGGQGSSSPRRSGHLRSSKENLLTDYQSQTLPLRDSKKRDRAFTQPQFSAGEREKSRSHMQISQNHMGMVSQHPVEPHMYSHRGKVQAVHSNPLPPHHRSSETLLNGGVGNPSTFSQQGPQPSRVSIEEMRG